MATLNQNLRRRAGGAKRKRSVLNACRARAKTRQDKYIKTERSRAVAGSAPRGQPRRRTPARRRDRRRPPPPPPDPASASCSSSSSCYRPLPHPFDPVLLPSPVVWSARRDLESTARPRPVLPLAHAGPTAQRGAFKPAAFSARPVARRKRIKIQEAPPPPLILLPSSPLPSSSCSPAFEESLAPDSPIFRRLLGIRAIAF